MSIDNVSGTSSNTGNVNGSKRAAGSGATETGQSVKGSSNLGKDEFLKLLVAQLKNQDPMSPQQNGEFIAPARTCLTSLGPVSLRLSWATGGRYHGAHAIQVDPMTEQTSTLYAKLLGETAVISWAELQPFFARGALLQVDAALDLVEVAEALAGDDREKVAAWLSCGGLSKVGEDAAKDFLERDPTLWAVVVAPWVVIQERAEKATLH